MLITFVLSLIYFGIIVNFGGESEALWIIIFYIWPPLFTLISVVFWWLFRKMGIGFGLKK